MNQITETEKMHVQNYVLATILHNNFEQLGSVYKFNLAGTAKIFKNGLMNHIVQDLCPKDPIEKRAFMDNYNDVTGICYDVLNQIFDLKPNAITAEEFDSMERVYNKFIQLDKKDPDLAVLKRIINKVEILQ